MAPLIPNLGTGWGEWLASYTRRLTPREGVPGTNQMKD